MNSIDVSHATIVRVILAVAIALAFPATMLGQADQGAITGTVTDGQGAVIPSAQVKLLNTDTNFELQTTTDSRVVYTFQPIRIGRYSLTVSLGHS